MTEQIFSPATRLARWLMGARPATAPSIEAADPLAPMSPRYGWWHGSKYPGGLGGVNLLVLDYWTLRARSAELFRTNLYARGLIRRLVTNEINTGLHLEAKPEESILGYQVDGLADWSETIENRFRIWEADPLLCDFRERQSFGGLQAAARAEALVAGDVLVTMRQDQRTGLPRLQLTNASSIQTPLDVPRSGNRILHGVELDPQGCQVAYWVTQQDGKSKRLPAWGEKSGRRLSWLVYGTDKRLDDVRGEPILSLVLQSVKEIDRYRDAVQRKAALNAVLAMFIKRQPGTTGGRSWMGNAGISRGTDVALDASGAERTFNFSEYAPGLILDQLEAGEEPQGFQSNGTDEKFADFESAIIQAIAWANNVPPEILTLGFRNNYSASQAAINEFKLYLNVIRTEFGEQFCRPCYLEWLLAECLARKVENASSILEARRTPEQYDLFGAWTANDWAGQIKPAVDFSKLVGGYGEACDNGFLTRDQASRELTGSKFSKNVAQLARENAALADANAALAALDNPPAPVPEAPDSEGSDDDDVDDEEEKPETRAHLRPVSRAKGN